MEPLSLRLFFTLTVLLAVLFSAASTAANENEITKHKATESRYLGQTNASSFCLLPCFNFYEFYFFVLDYLFSRVWFQKCFSSRIEQGCGWGKEVACSELEEFVGGSRKVSVLFTASTIYSRCGSNNLAVHVESGTWEPMDLGELCFQLGREPIWAVD